MVNEKIENIFEIVFEENNHHAANCSSFEELECWDSLRYVQLVMTVQATFGIELTQEQIVRIITPAGLNEVLKEHGISL